MILCVIINDNAVRVLRNIPYILHTAVYPFDVPVS